MTDDRWHIILEQMASDRDESCDRLVARMLFSPLTAPLAVKRLGTCPVTWLPGRSPSTQPGPQGRAKVMMIGLAPGAMDTANGRAFVGSEYDDMFAVLHRMGIDVSSWYFTNVVRFCMPGKSKSPPAAWIRAGMDLVQAEIDIVDPDYIVACGTHVVAALLGKGASLKKVRGSESLEYGRSRVVATCDPTTFDKDPKAVNGFRLDMRILQKIMGGSVMPDYSKYETTVINNHAKLKSVVDDLLARGEHRFGLDCEWGAEFVNPETCSDFSRDGRLRMIQFAPRPGESYVVHIRSDGMLMVWQDDIALIGKELRRLFCRPEVEIGGHNLRSDLKFLNDSRHANEIGLDIMDAFMRGIDTMLAWHVLKPQSNGFGLEHLSVEFTDLGRYDLEVQTWVNDHNPYDTRQVGYAYVPDELLIPYAAMDPDVVIQAWPKLVEALKRNRIAKPYEICGNRIETQWDFYRHVVHAVTPAIDAMEREGLAADRTRMAGIVELFTVRKQQLETSVRDLLGCQEFNFRSLDHLYDLLYGMTKDGKPVLPAEVRRLKLTPVKTTEKPARDWASIPVEELSSVSPSTDGESLRVLAETVKDEHAVAVLTLIRQLKFIDQQVKNFVRPAVEVGGAWYWDSGLMYEIDGDGRTRTSIGQLTDSGRYTSSTPNLQNLTKKQEAELIQIFSPDPVKLRDMKGWQSKSLDELKSMGVLNPRYFSLRSCYTAPPGYLLVEADYKQAELAALGYLSGDPELISIIEDESRDLHSEMAIIAFQLKCDPKDVKKLYPAQRVMAKSVNFGCKVI